MAIQKLKSDADFLKEVSLFDGIDDKALIQIFKLGKVVNYRPGQIIIQEGQRGGNIHIVISGRAEISKAGKELNKKKYLGDIDRGSIFGEMSVFDKGPYSATVKARQDCSIHVVKGEDFKNFLKKNPDLAYGVFSTLISLMSSRLRRANSALSLTGI